MSDRVDAIRERLDEATRYNPAPWRLVYTTDDTGATTQSGVLDAHGSPLGRGPLVAGLMANAPTDIEFLLAELDKALTGPLGPLTVTHEAPR